MNDRLLVDVLQSSPGSVLLRLDGDIDAAGDTPLGRAYSDAVRTGATTVVLDFAAVDYINSTGIALIVRLLADARRHRRAVVARGLSDHYREILRITGLSDYLTIAEHDPSPSPSPSPLEETTP